MEFRELANYPGYRFGNDGSVWSLRKRGAAIGGKGTNWGTKWRLMSPCPVRGGYLSVTIRCRDGRPKSKRVHQLVAEAFLGERPKGWHTCHNDGVVTNNALANLRYDTPSGNYSDEHKHGTRLIGVRRPMAKLNDDLVRLIRLRHAAGLPIERNAAALSVSHQVVRSIIRGETWRHVA